MSKKGANRGVVKKSSAVVKQPGFEFEGVRTDLEDFFRLTDALDCQNRCHYPFIVFLSGIIVIEQSPERLVSNYPGGTQVLCQWPGKWSSDFFLFTVKEFSRRYAERKARKASRG